ncbi:hypothetical protein JW905_06525 [bacterium]|nr:hypothetical protein [candidate division CSSED10-310 bacterium]
MSSLHDNLSGILSRTVENNLWRQHRCVNLIPSETTPSLLVKLCEISDPAGRYAEHRTMKGREVYFYQGIDFIRDVEEQAREAMQTYFNCSNAELRPISGQMANEVVFKAVTKYVNRQDEGWRRLRKVMNNDLTKGGHLSSQPMGALFNYVEIDPATGKEHVINFPVLPDNPYRIDVDEMKTLLAEHHPELVVFGKSMFIYHEPVKELADFVADWEDKPVIMYDMAHVLGLYGAFQEPLAEGANVVTGSTHKTFFGPQRGIIAGNMEQPPIKRLWREIKSRAFPGSTSNHHLGTLLALLVATIEMNQFKKEYQEAVRRNARAFAQALVKAGVDVEGDPADGYTETHQVLLRVSKYGKGEDLAMRLEKNNIVTNYQALPDDDSFLESSGIRTGVQEMTRYGMAERDFEVAAGFIADVIIRNKDVSAEVHEFRKNFMTMHYCMEPGEIIETGAPILASMMPNIDYVKRFAETMVEVAHRLI